MADYNEAPYKRNVRAYHPTGNQAQAFRLEDRSYATNDTVRVIRLERDTKIVNGYIACVVAPGATAEFDLVVTDGTTTKVLVDGANLATANTVVHMNDVEAAGWVTDNQDYWLEVQAKSVATPASAVLIVGWTVTNQMIGGEGAF